MSADKKILYIGTDSVQTFVAFLRGHFASHIDVIPTLAEALLTLEEEPQNKLQEFSAIIVSNFLCGAFDHSPKKAIDLVRKRDLIAEFGENAFQRGSILGEQLHRKLKGTGLPLYLRQDALQNFNPPPAWCEGVFGVIDSRHVFIGKADYEHRFRVEISGDAQDRKRFGVQLQIPDGLKLSG